ncbi:MAG: tRNA dihydrouridine synthase DusB [Lachnospiraceae bacterium]|nr:tRNA dihydrouridine synthase DusB [Lachnospiraceae bacterium]
MTKEHLPAIGGVVLSGPLLLGPMAGVTDHPFRLLCREMGAAMTAAEMVSANAIKYGNKKTYEFIDIRKDEAPVSLQLFGPDPATFAVAIDRLRDYPYDILDINMGCPMPKIVKNGEGCALMQNPKLAEDIIRECVRLSDRPVTVKIRAGFANGDRSAVELAKRAEYAGAAAVAVHGRTREQYYTGRADWSIIRDVKEAVSIPVVGNGDVTDGASARSMMNETGCDCVMIARGARGNPWVFREAAAYLSGQSGADKRPSGTEICDMMMRHARMQVEEKGEHMGICQMRKHIGWYTVGLPGSALLRAQVNRAADFQEMEDMIREYRSSLGN